MTVGPRTRAALQSLGYLVEPYNLRSAGPLEEFFAFSLNGQQAVGRRLPESEDAAWTLCLDHLKANAEAQCSRMIAALLRASEAKGEMGMGKQKVGFLGLAGPYSTDGTIKAQVWNGSGHVEVPTDKPHDAVLALFLKVCCDEVDAA